MTAAEASVKASVEVSGAPAVDHRRRPRRRGRALDEAILSATIDEIAENGYENLHIERVAERARTGKASVYRRWPSKVRLVVAAIYHARPDPAATSDTGSLRGDLVALLGAATETLGGPVGAAIRGVASEALRDPVVASEMRSLARESSLDAVREAVRRAHDRGELDASRITSRQLDVGLSLMRFHFLTHTGPVPPAVITEIVDQVVLPLLLAVGEVSGPRGEGSG